MQSRSALDLLCVRARACVRACVRVRVRACVDVCIYMRTDMRVARSANRWRALADAVILSTDTPLPAR